MACVTWTRITEVLGRNGDGRGTGLLYHFPCGHEEFASSEKLEQVMRGVGVLPVVCLEGCEEEVMPESVAPPADNVISFPAGTK